MTFSTRVYYIYNYMINCAYDVIPAKAGIQKFKDRDSKTGFRVKPGVTIKEDKNF
jgi:hypothetical protein